MKKISILLMGLAVGAMAFTSCQQERNPKIQKPTEFVLNTPTMSGSTQYLSSNATVEFSWSQPDYGVALVANYEIEISDDPEFATSAWICAAGSETPNVYQNCKTTVTGQEFSLAMMHYYGWEDEETFDTTPRTIYVRVLATVDNYEEGAIYSNAVALNVVPYFVSLGPDQIWVVGECQGWSITNESMPLTETEAGSKIYKGTYEIPAGQFQFRFYDKLGDWENYSIGAQDPDSPVEITMTDGKYEGPVFFDPSTEKTGKGAWQISSWTGGVVAMTVDLNEMKVVFETKNELGEIYIVGSPTGWDINSDAMALKETAVASGIYTGTFNLEAGAEFRFYTALGDWETNSIGSQEADESIDITIPYAGVLVNGKGKWKLGNGGNFTLTVDTKAMTVDFKMAE